MGKYFGTDGVRGVANSELTAELAYRLGRAGGYVLSKHLPAGEQPKVLIGRDTRISGHMLEGALIAGLLSIGAEVMRLGVISTPGVAYLTKSLDATAGVMISASHNPVADNGIKFFGSDGFKLDDATEAEIEDILDASEDTLPRPVGKDLGFVSDYYEGAQKYLQMLKQTVDEDFDGLHIALDCAHGATSGLAARLFADLEANVSTIGNSPNGLNINEGVGSTHPEHLAEFVREKGADMGLAFDGDGDRLIAIDENGDVVDGDMIMYICGKYLSEQGRLKDNTIVATEEAGMTALQTAVGDRYVVEEMKKHNYTLGGEQSGHLIFLDHSTTGDGMLSGVQLAQIVKTTGRKLSELAAEMPVYPQKLVNIRVTDKNEAMNGDRVLATIQEAEAEMNGNGRILVRASGTEPLVRVMAEAPTSEECDRYVERIAQVVREDYGVEG